MSWWSDLTGRFWRPGPTFDPTGLPMPGWELAKREPRAAYWRDHSGDVISLTIAAARRALPSLSDTVALQRKCRGIAESQRAGLVEVSSETGAEGRGLTYVYKRLEGTGFKFFGVHEVETPLARWLWMLVFIERGTTGMREAIVTAKLLEAGELTLESYAATWARDPYDPGYSGVDRRTLRYHSDGVEFDEDFPDHPLTKTRRELRRLLTLRVSPSIVPTGGDGA